MVVREYDNAQAYLDDYAYLILSALGLYLAYLSLPILRRLLWLFAQRQIK